MPMSATRGMDGGRPGSCLPVTRIGEVLPNRGTWRKAEEEGRVLPTTSSSGESLSAPWGPTGLPGGRPSAPQDSDTAASCSGHPKSGFKITPSHSCSGTVSTCYHPLGNFFYLMQQLKYSYCTGEITNEAVGSMQK